ncbi:MAG: class I SAM-dependent methyltransferase [Planctomycetota bacterium]|nr:class I SAM-dependent methyltransferase [Planctomycetota bacterium]
MTRACDYDAFADIYRVWAESAGPITVANKAFYVDECTREPGVTAELGVGDGRIAIEIARAGKAMVGVDNSSAMLERCRANAAEAGVADRLTLIQADFRDFELPEPADLITLPFHSIGHMISLDDKREAFGHVLTQLAPGGRFVFDHFVFDPELARANERAASVRAEFEDDEGRHVVLWSTTLQDYDAQTMRILIFTDTTDADGYVVQRRYRFIPFSWIEPDQTRALLTEAGFEIETVYGDFDRNAFTEESRSQIWVARRSG